MIPYEDLVSALTMWRERNGLPTGASDYLGEPPAPEPVSFAAYERRPPSHDGGAEIADEWPGEEVAFEDAAAGSDPDPYAADPYTADDGDFYVDEVAVADLDAPLEEATLHEPPPDEPTGDDYPPFEADNGADAMAESMTVDDDVAVISDLMPAVDEPAAGEPIDPFSVDPDPGDDDEPR